MTKMPGSAPSMRTLSRQVALVAGHLGFELFLGHAELVEHALGDAVGHEELHREPAELVEHPLGDAELVEHPLGDAELAEHPSCDAELVEHPLGDAELVEHARGDAVGFIFVESDEEVDVFFAGRFSGSRLDRRLFEELRMAELGRAFGDRGGFAAVRLSAAWSFSTKKPSVQPVSIRLTSVKRTRADTVKERESLIVVVLLLDSTSHRAGVEILLKRAVTFLDVADARRWDASVRVFVGQVPPFAKTVPFASVAAPEAALCAPRLRPPLHVRRRFFQSLGEDFSRVNVIKTICLCR